MAQELSVVIPTLDAAASLPDTLAALAAEAAGPLRLDVVVVDGGSTDETCAVAGTYGVRVVASPPGRGRQLAAGADATSSAWLLFVHADTVLAPGWATEVARFIARTSSARRAAVFRYALDDPSPAARRLAAMVAWRGRMLGLPYGDQGLLISRALYDEIGGYRPLPLMEDVDIVRRIGRRRLQRLGTAAVTSAARYRRGGYVLRPLRNLTCLGLYLVGIPPRLIQRLYR